MTDRLRVLYVDDETALLELAKLFLEKGDLFFVDTVTSPGVALDKLNSELYDAIISDYQMPEMDGITFLKQLKGTGDATPFIIFTGRGREEVVIEALNEGADFYLQKGGEPRSQFAELSNKIRYAVTRRQAEEALHDTTEHLHNLFFYANAPIMAWDPDYHITRFNPALEHLSGRSEKEVQGKTLDFLFPDTSREASMALIEKALKGERWETVEIPILTKDGTIRIVIWNSANILDPKGRIVSTIAQGIDITERKQTEIALQKNEEWYRTLVASVNEAIILQEKTGEVLTWNRAAEHLFGVPAKEVLGHTATSRKWETIREDGSEFPDSKHPSIHTLETGEACRNVVMGIKKDDGTLSWVNINTSPLFGPGDTKPYAVVISFLDITERKQGEIALQSAQEKYTKAFLASPDAIMISDLETGCFVEMNDVTSQIFGYSRDEMIGKNALELGIWLKKEDWDDLITQVKKSGRVKGYEVYNRHKSGKLFNASISADTITLDGRVHLISIVRNITEHIRAEEALRQINKKLNQLSGITRHDIKNQLHALKRLLDLSARSAHDPEKVSRFIEDGQKIADIIEQQINITKDYENIGIKGPIWQNIGYLFKMVMKQQNMNDIAMRLETTDFEVFADPLLERVFFNLIDNTRRHGGQVSYISLSTAARENELVVIYEDDGQGIPNADKPYIFNRGFGKNTGLGLFLACQILSITAITITETGEPGKGARFEMTVPEGMWRIAENSAE